MYWTHTHTRACLHVMDNIWWNVHLEAPNGLKLFALSLLPLCFSLLPSLSLPLSPSLLFLPLSPLCLSPSLLSLPSLLFPSLPPSLTLYSAAPTALPTDRMTPTAVAEPKPS